MDKVEYQNRLNEITECVHIRDYQKAYELTQGIDWRRVKSIRTLNMVADIYEANKDYAGCRKILLIALNRSSIGKSILYRLTEVCLKEGNLAEAEKYYSEFKKAAPRDNSRLILEYKLCKAKNAPIDEQIRLLEEYKDREYTERWAYELALLYSRAGDGEKCVEACDDMILWFSEGKYVLKAMELKKQYQDLSPSQQMYFDKEQKIFEARQITAPDAYDVAGVSEPAADEDVDASPENWPPAEPAEEKAAEEPAAAAATVTAAAAVAEEPAAAMSEPAVAVSEPAEAVSEPAAAVSQTAEQKPVAAAAAQKAERKQAAVAATVTAAAATVTAAAAETPAEDDDIAEEQFTVLPDEPETDEGAADNEPEIIEVDTDDLPPLVQTFAEPEDDEITAAAESKKPILDDREIPDPEPTPGERITHTISLSEIGQNTVPIPIEEIMKSETPEERRIRILSHSDSPMMMNDKQRQIFTYFARVPGMDRQILDAITSVYTHAGEHTSSHGNIAIMGAAGSGKTKLAEDLVVAMCSDMGLDAARTARIKGDRMNELDPARVVARMSGGFLMIENVSDMNAETVTKLGQAMDFRTDCMIVIVEDEKTALRSFFKKYPAFAEKFDRTVSIPVFTNDELVTFARTYCAENNCELDDMGVLALYTIISSGQSEDQPMTISQVKKIVDSAITKARKGRKSGRKSSGQAKTITLYEKDFSA